jgi:hypothetical protein
MSLPASKSLDLYRGDTFPFAARLWSDDAMTVPVDLSSVTPRAQIRTECELVIVDSLILEIACVVELPNIVHMTIAAASWPEVVPERARWDLELVDATAGTVRTVLAGPVRITDDVTVPA